MHPHPSGQPCHVASLRRGPSLDYHRPHLGRRTGESSMALEAIATRSLDLGGTLIWVGLVALACALGATDAAPTRVSGCGASNWSERLKHFQQAAIRARRVAICDRADMRGCSL
jgi:hypothetical protein